MSCGLVTHKTKCTEPCMVTHCIPAVSSSGCEGSHSPLPQQQLLPHPSAHTCSLIMHSSCTAMLLLLPLLLLRLLTPLCCTACSWLMGEDVRMCTPGTNPSHLVVYPQPNVDYATPPALNIDRLMQHVCNSTLLNFSVQEIVVDADKYKASAAERATAARPAVPTGAASSVAGPPLNPVLRRVLAGAAAASEAATAVFGPLDGAQAGSSSPQADDAAAAGAAAPAAAAAAVGVSVRGLTLLPRVAAESLEPRQQLALFLRRRLLPLRVAARRIAAAEAWAQHVAEQQQQREQAAAAGNAEEDALLQGLSEEPAGEGKPAAGDGGQQQAAAPEAEAEATSPQQVTSTPGAAGQESQGPSGDAADTPAGSAPAANGVPVAAAAEAEAAAEGGSTAEEVEQVLEQLRPRIAARAEQLLLQQPLVLSDVLATFQADYAAAAEQLGIQVGCAAVAGWLLLFTHGTWLVSWWRGRRSAVAHALWPMHGRHLRRSMQEQRMGPKLHCCL